MVKFCTNTSGTTYNLPNLEPMQEHFPIVHFVNVGVPKEECNTKRKQQQQKTATKKDATTKDCNTKTIQKKTQQNNATKKDATQILKFFSVYIYNLYLR